MCALASFVGTFHSCLFEVYYLSQATKFRPPLPLMWMKLFALLALHICFYSHFSHSQNCCWRQLYLLNYSLSKMKTQQPRWGLTLDRLCVKTINTHNQFCAVFPPIWNQFYSSAPKWDSWLNTNSLSCDCHHSHLHIFLNELFTDPNITSSS